MYSELITTEHSITMPCIVTRSTETGPVKSQGVGSRTEKSCQEGGKIGGSQPGQPLHPSKQGVDPLQVRGSINCNWKDVYLDTGWLMEDVKDWVDKYNDIHTDILSSTEGQMVDD